MKIGLFDSGIGGLSVLYELVKRIPSARYVYVADTFRAPYGTKPMEDILRISLEVLSFLKLKGVDCIVSGCNTSDASLQRFKSDLGILNDPRPGEPRLVYYPHLYTLDLDINGEYMGKSTWINLWAHSRQEEYKRYNTPMLIGEFGLGGSEPLALEYIEEVMQMNDKITGGWFYWDYDGSWGIWDYEKGEEYPKARVLDRPYPRMIAGTSPLFSFDTKKKLFSLEMNWSKNAELKNDTTEIYIPSHIWPNGWNLKEIEGKVDWKFNADKRLLYVVPQKEGKVHIEVGLNSAKLAE